MRFAHVLVWLVHSEAKSMEKKLQQTPCIGDVAVDEHQCYIMIANITRILDKESKLKWPPKSLLISSSEAVIVKVPAHSCSLPAHFVRRCSLRSLYVRKSRRRRTRRMFSCGRMSLRLRRRRRSQECLPRACSSTCWPS